MIKPIIYFLQSIFVYFSLLIAKLIGLDLSRKLFSKIFIKYASLFRSKKIIESNLKKLQNSRLELEKEKIISSMWSNYGMTFIEYFFLSKFKKNNSHILIKGENNLNNLIMEKKPVIFVSGHFANYELMSMEIAKKNIKLATIYRPLIIIL